MGHHQISICQKPAPGRSSLISKQNLFKGRTMSYTEVGKPNETLVFFGMRKGAKQIEDMITLIEFLQCAEHCS